MSLQPSWQPRWQLFPATAFDEHAETWRTLNAATARTPLLAPEFVAPLLREFATSRTLLAICTAADGIVAMTVLAARGGGIWEVLQPSQAPLGLWLHRPDIPLEPLLAALTRRLPGVALLVGLTQRDPLLEARPPDSPTLRTLDYIRTAHVPVAGSFDDYWNARGKNLRSNLKKQRARLLKDGTVTRLQIDRLPEQMALAVADYGRLESAGWKAQLGTAIHPDNAQGRFYAAMLAGFAARGQAAVYRYWFDRQLVAMDLCIEGEGTLIVLKTTYDETVPPGLSPTLLMREEGCRRLFDEKQVVRLEFYGKVMEWHTRWTDEIRTMYHVNHYRWPLLRQLHAAAGGHATLLQRLRKRSVPAPARQPTPTME
ncbi:CelD/BcsL family acetyltransferase involved in cellulose biosynthesis [Pseudoduganella lurida]|uniref:CelD/BcsL family acetyltransferase involved in cellulose biosynthesis n=1 Tax=Pseudoduganella lurida TaxID=1036180 RepID=A0A562R2C6_9BURK|nr:GNAT family N-acetyltransferase [Pseudoduganella lurida]TWI62983.1 CelD/BcsL family acetyltransferase involved in cellulose biosynthesis [Pseudoduganella lurida]